MHLIIMYSFLFYVLAYVLAFEDILEVLGDNSYKMMEQGRAQYQVRSNLSNFLTINAHIFR